MNTATFSVILHGTVLPGFDIDEAVRGLATIIKREPSVARQLLSGHHIKIKSGVDANLGEHYIDVLKKVGASAFLGEEVLDVDDDLDRRVGSTTQQISPKAQGVAASAPAAVALWNPSAAANWSLPFTPILGTYLHWKNWSNLGDQTRTRQSLIWYYATIGIYALTLLVNIIGGLIEAPRLAAAFNLLTFSWLFIWYFGTARFQIRFVKDHYPNYLRKSWKAPLIRSLQILGSTYLILFLSYFLLLGIATGKLRGPKPVSLAEPPSESMQQHPNPYEPQPVVVSSGTEATAMVGSPAPSQVVTHMVSEVEAKNLLVGRWICVYLEGQFKGSAYPVAYRKDSTYSSSRAESTSDPDRWEILPNGSLVENSTVMTRLLTLQWESADQFVADDSASPKRCLRTKS